MDTEVTNISDAKINQIIERGQDIQRKTVEGIFEFAQCVADLKVACDHGEFQRLAEQKWGLKETARVTWIKISNQNRDLIADLPPSYSTIELITRLTPEQQQQGIMEGVIHPGASQREVRSFMNNFRGVVAKATKKVKAVVSGVDDMKDIDPDELIDQIGNLVTPALAVRLQPASDGFPSFAAQSIKASAKQINDIIEPMRAPEKRQAAKALLTLLTYQTQVFAIELEAAKTKRIRELEAKLADELKRQKEKTKKITGSNVQLPVDVFSTAEIKRFRKLLYPDYLQHLTTGDLNELWVSFKRVYP